MWAINQLMKWVRKELVPFGDTGAALGYGANLSTEYSINGVGGACRLDHSCALSPRNNL